jgi:hypothetical protein
VNSDKLFEKRKMVG